jgi:hypothetical protein
MTADKPMLRRRQKEDKSKFTHDAYVFKREGTRKGRPVGYWELEGYTRIEADGSVYTYLHSSPIGGFDGRIKSYPYGSEAPPDEEGEDDPQRPADSAGGVEDT